MEIQEAALRAAEEELKRRRHAGDVLVYSIEIVNSVPEIQVVTIGPDSSWVNDFRMSLKSIHPGTRLRIRNQESVYYFLAEAQAQESRPGSGIIRVVSGIPEGPAGTLTCFLSSKDGRDIYFAAAGHVVSNFWTLKGDDSDGQVDRDGSVYSYRKGFPPSNSRRLLGDLSYLTPRPRSMRSGWAQGNQAIDLDMGIVKFEGEFQWIQRTTCYGTFGEWPGIQPSSVGKDDCVMKCGSEEPHWTFAQVESVSETIYIYGPDGLYELRGQVILKEINDPAPRSARENQHRAQFCGSQKPVSFAVPGDSGAMVVHRYSRVPVGMLIGGSVLDGRYIMTPIHELWKCWERRRLVLLRA